MPIRGLSEFSRALDDIVARANVATRAAVAEAAHLIEAEAKKRAPVETGTLRRSIRVEGPKAESLAVYSARIGPTVIYGRRIELGFRGSDSLGRVYNQAGQPYLRPAFESVNDRLAEIFRRSWSKAIAG